MISVMKLTERNILNRVSTLFLRVVILLVAMTVLLCMVWFPQIEGRAANMNIISIYTDPLIIYCYIASIPFFAALCQAFKLLGYVDNKKIFSPSAVKAVRNIKYCAIAISGSIILGILYIRLFANGDDPTGVTVVGVITAFASVVIATGASVFERILQKE
jgi:cytochrome bd-type quinol oxidase subunit 2